jgi:hypothetical protein
VLLQHPRSCSVSTFLVRGYRMPYLSGVNYAAANYAAARFPERVDATIHSTNRGLTQNQSSRVRPGSGHFRPRQEQDLDPRVVSIWRPGFGHTTDGKECGTRRANKGLRQELLVHTVPSTGPPSGRCHSASKRSPLSGSATVAIQSRGQTTPCSSLVACCA